jgi:hypothetical protein
VTTQANIPSLRPDGPPLVLAVDAEGEAVDACDALIELMGPARTDVEGSSWRDRIAPWCQPRVDELLHVNPAAAPARVELVGRRADGLPFAIGLSPTRLAGSSVGDRLLVGARLGGPLHWRAGSPGAGPSAGRGEPHVRGIDSVLSHDVRGALRGATGFATVVSRAFADSSAAALSPALAKVEDHLGIALGALASADALVEAVVRFLRAADETLVIGPVTVGELVERALNLSAAGPTAREASVHLAPDTAEVAVLGDMTKLVEILAELFANSRKFGGESVSISVSARADAHGWIVLAVSDDGPGVDQSLLDDAFAPGRMLQPRGRYPGVGMGLALCRLLATRHAGRCEFDATRTAPGKGAVVRLLLPSAQ